MAARSNTPPGKHRGSSGALLLVILLSPACESSSPPARYPPTQSAPPTYATNQAPGYPPPGGQPPYPQPATGAPPASGSAQPGAPPPAGQNPFTQLFGQGASIVQGFAAGFDPINLVDFNYLRLQASFVMREVIGALRPERSQRVQNIPLAYDDTPGEVNAFAMCTDERRPWMVISDGLLDVLAHLAKTKSTDERFGTNKVFEYISFIAKNQQPDQPVVRPPAGFFDPAQQTDAGKVERQHQIFDEELAFVLGHELAHHYLGHLSCTAPPDPSGAGAIWRVASSRVPRFNQLNEYAADVAGVNSLLDWGSRRSGYRLTEGGALLFMDFLIGVDQASTFDILFGFEETHPPAQLRKPALSAAASAWRSGNPIPM